MMLRVTRKAPVADRVVLLDLRRDDGGDLPAWEPGAHIDLRCGDLVRQYSLCGKPTDRSAYRIAVRREEPGRGGSQYVHDVLTENDHVVVRGPRNNFPLVAARRYVFIAGGIGITPILPMVEAAAAAGRDWELVYGGRDRPSMPFRDELTARDPARVTLRPEDEHGLIDLDRVLAGRSAGTAVYCCGPEPLLRALEERAAAWTTMTLHVERFTPREQATGGDVAFTIEIASTGEVLSVPIGQSVLTALERAGIPVLSSCTEGTCGTCETGVLAGEVDHRDSVLTDDERKANDVMFVCVSRSRGDHLVLDL